MMEKNNLNGHDDFEMFQAGGNQPLDRKTRLIIGIAAVVLIFVLGLFAPALIEMIEGGKADTGKEPTQTQTATSGETDAQGALSIEMPQGRYNATAENTPGMPFRAICPGADAIRFTTDNGIWLEYGAPDYTVVEHGTELACASGETVYLSPAADKNKYRVTVKALSGEHVLGSALIILNVQGNEIYVESVTTTAYAQ